MATPKRGADNSFLLNSNGETKAFETIEDDDELSTGKNNDCIVNFCRIVIVLFLLAAAGVLGWLSYYFLSESSSTSFEKNWDYLAQQVINGSIKNGDAIFKSIAVIASLYPTVAGQTINTLPFLTLRDFEHYALEARQGQATTTGILTIVYSPIIVNETDRAAWQKYSAGAQGWIEDAYSYYPDLTYTPQTIRDDIWTQPGSPAPADSGPYLPSWQMSPPPLNASKIVNFDYASTSGYYTFMQQVIQSKTPLLSEPANISSIFAISPPVGTTTSVLLEPVFSSLNTPTSLAASVVGLISALIPWTSFFVNVLQPGQEGVLVVAESCEETNQTFLLNGPQVTWLGAQDLHDPKYNDYVYQTPFANFPTTTTSSDSSYRCNHNLYVYPTDATKASLVDTNSISDTSTSTDPYNTNAIILTSVVASCFVVAAVLFVVYDGLLRRRRSQSRNQEPFKSQKQSRRAQRPDPESAETTVLSNNITARKLEPSSSSSSSPRSSSFLKSVLRKSRLDDNMDNDKLDNGPNDNDDNDSFIMETNAISMAMTSKEDQMIRLVQYNTQVLMELLQQVVVRRQQQQEKQQQQRRPRFTLPDSLEKVYTAAKSIGNNNTNGRTVADEAADVIDFPPYDPSLYAAANAQSGSSRSSKNGNTTRSGAQNDLSPQVLDQLYGFVAVIAGLYRDNPFHNFEHASHVTMSLCKMLSRVEATIPVNASSMLTLGSSSSPPPPTSAEAIENNNNNNRRDRRPFVVVRTSDFAPTIAADPLTRFAMVVAALIHDVDHRGIPNSILLKEEPTLASAYQRKSVHEQNALELAWNVLLSEGFEDLCECIFVDLNELKQFRQVLVNCVMATDIFDEKLRSMRKARYNQAFSLMFRSTSSPNDINRKATIVMEYLLQAADIAPTLQPWYLYTKWNEKLFEEEYAAFQSGRAPIDPSPTWYQEELDFFDNYSIPLARSLKNCEVFGVSGFGDEYLTFAEENRRIWAARGKQIVDLYVENYCR